MAWKPAYLIHGDDHGRIAERRNNLRRQAEAESGTGGVEVLEGEAADPELVAGALSAMTFAIGRRFVIVEGAERWKEADTAPVAAALATLDGETTVALFAREEGRFKAPEALHEAVTKAGGQVLTEAAVKPKELPKWCTEQARALGVRMDMNAARALIGIVGDRQQRLLREIEKLVLEHGEGAEITTAEIEEGAAASAEKKIFALGDAIVGGNRRDATRVLLELQAQGERVPGLIYAISRELRQVVLAAEQLAAGRPQADIKRQIKPYWKADNVLAAAGRRDIDSLRRALERIADLELESRGGGPAPPGDEATAALRAVLAISR